MRQTEKDLLSLGMLLLVNKELGAEFDKEKLTALYEEYFNKDNIDAKTKKYAEEIYKRVKMKFK
ncbi:hypothetical protein D3C71_1234590 [compost metagenome]